MTNAFGQLDLIIKVPSTRRTIIIEFKVVSINFLAVNGHDWLQKATTLSSYLLVRDVLNIKFGNNDNIQVTEAQRGIMRRRAGLSIEEWIMFYGPANQLLSYWNGNDVRNMQRYG